MMCALCSVLCVCVRRAVQESPVVRMSMWKEVPNSGMYMGVRRYNYFIFSIWIFLCVSEWCLF